MGCNLWTFANLDPTRIQNHYIYLLDSNYLILHDGYYFCRDPFYKLGYSMKILIACEFSGIIREAFNSIHGCHAISCDLLPPEDGRNDYHYQGNVLDIINDGFDLMIAHPPCIYLSYAGTRYWNNPGRCKLRLEALEFFRILWEAPIHKICIENPKGCASPTIAKYSQSIQPFYFGDPYYKTTWLWLKNLPKLIYSKQDTFWDIGKQISNPDPIYFDNTIRGKARHFTESLNNSQDRSRSFPGIARAMAQQWGGL
jgi:hypothetical protein